MAWATVGEIAGLALIAAGLYQVYSPAAFIFAGAALILIAQGMEPHE